MIVMSPAAIEPTTEKPDVAHNQLQQTRGTSHDADTAKLKSRWSGRKPPNRKPPNRKLPNPKPPNQKPSNQKPSNQKPPKACHGWFDKKVGIEWARRYKASHHIKLARTTGGITK